MRALNPNCATATTLELGPSGESSIDLREIFNHENLLDSAREKAKLSACLPQGRVELCDAAE